MSTINGTPNGELAPYNGLTYISAFSLDLSGQPINGTMQLGLPPVVDVNSNGFNDCFESTLSVGATTSGTYTTAVGNGTVTANWQRAAGSPSGSCSLHLVDSIFGDLGSFNHVFELLEYTGPLLFAPGSNTVTASINLVQTDDPTTLIQGPLQFVKVSTNRFNRLILQPGTWTNSAAQLLTFTNQLFRRDLPWSGCLSAMSQSVQKQAMRMNGPVGVRPIRLMLSLRTRAITAGMLMPWLKSAACQPASCEAPSARILLP